MMTLADYVNVANMKKKKPNDTIKVPLTCVNFLSLGVMKTTITSSKKIKSGHHFMKWKITDQ